ncbi:MAG: hypothetical protein WC980_09030 [Candidatus Brocadiia bacterium]
MPKVEELKEKVVRLKKKLTETKDNKKMIRAVTKSLKRAQRKINTLTGKKLASKHKGEEGEKKPDAPDAAKPAPAPAVAKPAPAAAAPESEKK